MRLSAGFILCFFMTVSGFAADKAEIKISGSYTGSVVLADTTYTITIPSLPIRTLGKYAPTKNSPGQNGFIVDFETDKSKSGMEYRLYIFQDHWTLRTPSAINRYDIERASGDMDYFALRAKIGAVIQLPAHLIEGKILESVNYRDSRANANSMASPVQINLVTLTIKQGFLSSYPPKNKYETYDVTKNPDYMKNKDMAAKAGFDINTVLDRDFIAYYNGKYFFLLYYNIAEALGAKHEYLLQRVKITQSFLDKKGTKIRPDNYRYLVEAFKLNEFKQSKGTDRHHKCYTLEGAYKRETTVDIEIGVGSIPGMVEGLAWPFKSTLRYYVIQDYDPEPKLYDKVVFDHSKIYSYYFEFDADGNYDIRYSD